MASSGAVILKDPAAVNLYCVQSAESGHRARNTLPSRLTRAPTLGSTVAELVLNMDNWVFVSHRQVALDAPTKFTKLAQGKVANGVTTVSPWLVGELKFINSFVPSLA